MTEVRTRLCLNLRQKKMFLQAAADIEFSAMHVTPETSSVQKTFADCRLATVALVLRCVVPVTRCATHHATL